MPIFEYHCQKCGRDVELLVGVGVGSGEVRCPCCGGSDLKKLFSKFGVRSQGGGGVGGSSGSSCGSCSSSNCGTCN